LFLPSYSRFPPFYFTLLPLLFPLHAIHSLPLPLSTVPSSVCSPLKKSLSLSLSLSHTHTHTCKFSFPSPSSICIFNVSFFKHTHRHTSIGSSRCSWTA
jgi:hypothetical protein